MNYQDAFNTLASIGLVCLGWFAREMWTAMKTMKEDQSKLREELPAPIRFSVFDGAVNSGVGQSIRWLQPACTSDC